MSKRNKKKPTAPAPKLLKQFDNSKVVKPTNVSNNLPKRISNQRGMR